MDPYKSTYQSDFGPPNANGARGRTTDRTMSRFLDKFTYTTIYKQEFCTSENQPPREVVCQVEDTECRAKYVPGLAVGSLPVKDPQKHCLCQSGGLMHARGAKASGLPNYLDEECVCFSCGKCCQGEPSKSKPVKRTNVQPFPDEISQLEIPDDIPDEIPQQTYDDEDEGPCMTLTSSYETVPDSENPREPRNIIPWQRERRDERREPDVFRIPRNPPRGQARDTIQYDRNAPGPQRNVLPQHQFARPPSVARSEARIPGPFWTRQRPDERREINALRRRKFEVTSEARSVIHGEGAGGGGRRDDYVRRPGEFGCRRRPGQASGPRVPGPFWLRQRPDERREIDALRRRKFNVRSEARDVVHGEGTSAGPPGRHPLDPPRICKPKPKGYFKGPFWMRNRPDERQNPEVGRKKKFPTRTEIPDIVHGEEARARANQRGRETPGPAPRPIDPYDLPPGPSHADPFWMLERTDERRDPDVLRKKKGGRQPLQAAEIVHGEDFRENWYPSIRPGGSQEQEEVPELPRYMGVGRDDDDDDDDDDSDLGSMVIRRACGYRPRPPEGMPSSSFQQPPSIPWDVEEVIREPPPARISCAPESEVADFDQPNTFMRKLYEKYPYLYQILRETPPEDLAARVFKDRFLSTYQVDFLHMGAGATAEGPEGAAAMEERFVGPDGEPEPTAIPGCFYRYGQRGDFGRRNTEQSKREKKEKEEEEVDPTTEREEPRVSEYMATVSRLGGEIVNDQLYKVADITKNMKNDYKKL